jgi:hypothetical protein
MIAEAVLRVERVVGVAGPIQRAEGLVVSGPGVAVPEEDADRGAGGPPFEDPGQDLGLVGLGALGGELALTRPTAVEVGTKVVPVELEPGRTAVNDDPEARSVGFPEGGYSEQESEGVPGHVDLSSISARP